MFEKQIAQYGICILLLFHACGMFTSKEARFFLTEPTETHGYAPLITLLNLFSNDESLNLIGPFVNLE